MILRPQRLPKARDQIVRYLTDHTTPLRTNAKDDTHEFLNALTGHLQLGELYWVTSSMAALAMSAGATLPEARWATADRPAPCGLVVFEGGIGTLDLPPSAGPQIEEGGITTLRYVVPDHLPVDALTWGPSNGQCEVALWVSRARLADAYAQGQEMELPEGTAPPLIPTVSFELPVRADPVPWDELPDRRPVPVLAALASTWLLMQQPQLVERTVERPERSVRRAYARAGRPDPEVSVVELRRQYLPKDEDAGGERSSRRYRHRWVVSGHWRNQPYGRDRSLRRQTWVPAYVKGPEGAPLLATERVNVWRR